jgi:hypothetical protein
MRSRIQRHFAHRSLRNASIVALAEHRDPLDFKAGTLVAWRWDRTSHICRFRREPETWRGAKANEFNAEDAIFRSETSQIQDGSRRRRLHDDRSCSMLSAAKKKPR